MQYQENDFENVDNAKKERFIQGVTDIIKSIKSPYRVYIAGDIPPKKLKNAVGKIPILPGEEVIVLKDETVWGSAKKAVLITTWGIRINDISGKYNVPWEAFKSGFKIEKKKSYVAYMAKFVFTDHFFYNFECNTFLYLTLDALKSICKLAVEIFAGGNSETVAETIENSAVTACIDSEKDWSVFKAELVEEMNKNIKMLDKEFEEMEKNFEDFANPSAGSQKEMLDDLRRLCKIDGIDFEAYYEEHKNERGGLPRAAYGKLLKMLI